MESEQLAKRLWTFVISHGMLPILSLDSTKVVPFLCKCSCIKNWFRKSIFSDNYYKMT